MIKKCASIQHVPPLSDHCLSLTLFVSFWFSLWFLLLCCQYGCSLCIFVCNGVSETIRQITLHTKTHTKSHTHTHTHKVHYTLSSTSTSSWLHLCPALTHEYMYIYITDTCDLDTHASSMVTQLNIWRHLQLLPLVRLGGPRHLRSILLKLCTLSVYNELILLHERITAAPLTLRSPDTKSVYVQSSLSRDQTYSIIYSTVDHSQQDAEIM